MGGGLVLSALVESGESRSQPGEIAVSEVLGIEGRSLSREHDEL